MIGLWYRTTADRLGLADDDPIVTLESSTAGTAVEEDDVERRRFLQVAAVAPVLGLDATRHRMNADLRHVLPADEISRWRDITGTHVAAYGRKPPVQLLDALAPDMADLADLTSQCPRERDLSLVASQLCGLAGGLHTDLGNDRQARDWLHTSSRYASFSGETGQRYWVSVAQAMSALYGPTPQQVITISGRARSELGEHACAASAQLAGLTARAYARTGQPEKGRDELDLAEQIFARAAPDSGWFGFPEREFLMYRSGVLTCIGDAGAQDAQAAALDAYPVDDPMDRPLIKLEQARYLADQARDADAAAQTAIGAIAALDPAMRVPLLLDQAESVAPSIAALAPDAADRYREQLATLATQ